MAFKKKRSEEPDTEDDDDKPVNSKAPKAAAGARYVLFIGDEGTILIYMRGSVVESRQYVPDASEENLKELKATLEDDTKAPLMIIIDSMDQSYVQQTLPPVSSISVSKLIKKRLDRDFGENDIKGSIMLGREKTGRKDWNFLMVSVEKSRQLTMWLDFVYELPNRFLGIYLVSVEVEVIVKNLEKAMGVAKSGTGSKWKFFVSHNKVGGFRQVILHNGRIIFTRLAQPIGESTAEVIAGNIEQEMQSTIEYMKRLSYDSADGLDIYIVASGSIKTVLDKSKFAANVFRIMTPFELAKFLNIEGATQPTDQFGDVILAAGISAAPRHVLALTTPEFRQFDLLYKLSRLQRFAAAAIVVGLIIYAGSLSYDIFSAYSKSNELEESKIKRQQSLDALRAEIKKSNLDVDKTGDIIDLYQLLQKQRTAPLEFLAQVQTVIKPPILLRGVEWSVDDKPPPVGSTPPAGVTPTKGPHIIAVFTLEFPGVADLEAFRMVSKKVITDLRAIFKNHDIAFTKLPSKFSESEKLDMTIGDTQAQGANNNQDQTVQLTIREL